MNAYVASKIEAQIKEIIKRCHKRECEQCVEVFEENIKCQDEFINMKNDTLSSFHHPCESTVHIIKSTNKILQLIEQQAIPETNRTHDNVLRTIMSYLLIDDLYQQSNFGLHNKAEEILGPLSHKEEFIYKIVYEYMKIKSKKIGSRITEEEQGTYTDKINK